jgi:hypothetical protein
VVQEKTGKIYPLIDASSSILRGAEDSVFHNMKWYGAIYYQIVSKELYGEKKYFVLGFNSASTLNNKKIIECFQFKDDKLVLGGPYFEFLHPDKLNANRPANRFVIEYQKDAKVQLGWDEEVGMLVYDHLESTIGDPSKKSTFAPDGTYDGLKWVGNGWRIMTNVVKLAPQSESTIPVNNSAPKKVFQTDRE